MRVTRRDALKGLVASSLGTVTGLGTHGAVYEAHRLGITRTTVPVSGLPDALVGLRLGLLTDLHHSRTVPATDIEAAVGRLLAETPDLILLGGDYVTWGDERYVEPVADLLAPLTAPHGVYAVLGNHDPESAVTAALTRRGLAVLRDARTRVTARGESLELVGIRFWTRRAREIAPLLPRGTAPTVLLAHDPRRLTQAAALDVPLVVSGHTHGGQVVLPGLGAVAARKFPIAAGLLRRGPTSLFVSRGIGTVYVPCRINCPPEVVILTLARAGRL
jgi:predicted MPP superfamily phosphohydrolase